MSTIDERIVAMKFNNSQFESGVKTTMGSLDGLKKSLNMDGATKGLDDLDNAGKRFSLAGIGAAVDGIAGKFTAMSIVGITALTNIVNKAVNAGEQLAKSLTVDPISSGLDDYNTNLNAIQTILANTQSQGTNLKQVNDALNLLNTYSDKTIYNFSEMAKNIGTFTAAGVDLNTSVKAIKGISNLAALSGSSADQAATGMYQLSQAISSGTVRLQDWNSVQNAGFGGAVFQKALIQTAKVHGVKVDEMIKKNGSFRESLQEGWLSSKILTETLNQFTGDMTKGQLKALGYSNQQVKAIQKQAKAANEAATVVKTLPALVDTLKESVGSTWQNSFTILFGDFNQAKKLFTNVNNVLGSMISNQGKARNKMLQDWSSLGGRDSAISALANGFKALMSFITPVQEAFSHIFPAATGAQLVNITKAIEQFMKGLVLTDTASHNLMRTFQGVFAIFDIIFNIVGRVLGMFFNLFKGVDKGAGSILNFTGNIGDMLVRLDDAVKNGEGLTKFFVGLQAVLEVPIKLLKTFAGVLYDLFQGFQEGGKAGFADELQKINDRLNPLISIGNALQTVWAHLGGIFSKIYEIAKPIIDAIGDSLKNLGKAMGNALKTGDFSGVLDVINTGLLGGIVLLVKKFLSKPISFPGSGLFSSIKQSFEQLTGTLEAMQQNLKAKTLLMIAGAVGILTVSIIALSLIDTAALTKALVAITVMFAQLGGAMVGFDKLVGTKGAIKMVLIASSLLILASAIVILSAAIAILSGLSPEGIAKGLAAIGGALAVIGLAMDLMPKTLIITGAGLLVVSVAIMALAVALKILATLSWDDIGRSMAVLGASLAILAVGLTLMMYALPGAAALIVASVGLIALAVALKIMSSLSWDDIGRGMTVLGASLTIMAIGLTAMVASLPGAAALLVASGALVILALALKLMATLSWDDIGRAMVAMGGSLAILAVGLTLMVASLPGAAALLVATAALAILTPILMALGSMSWDQILTGIGALALALGVLAIAGVALEPAIPGLLGLGAAILLIGIGVLAAGVGVAALGIGLTALAAGGGAAVAILIAAVSGIASLIPYIVTQVGLGLIQLAVVIGQNGPAITTAIATLLLALVAAIVQVIPPLIAALVLLIQDLLTAIVTLFPQIISTLVLLITQLAEALVKLVPKLVDAGLRLIEGLLDGLAKNLPKIIEKGTDVIVAFLNGVAAAIPRILIAGANLVLGFLNGIADTIRDKTAEFNAAGLNIASAILGGMTSGLTTGIDLVIKAAKGVGAAAITAIRAILGIHSPSTEGYDAGMFVDVGIANGIDDHGNKVVKSATAVGDNVVDALKTSLSKASTNMSLGIDGAPTIRPVLDLTNIKNGSALINGMLGTPTMSLSKSYDAATAIAVKTNADDAAKSTDTSTGNTENTSNLTLIQNNTSPKALSAAEIYRNTQNQISLAKKELTGIDVK